MSEDTRSDSEKDPSETTAGGDSPMTADQRSQIEELAGEEDRPEKELTQAEAEQLIDQLRHRTSGETG